MSEYRETIMIIDDEELFRGELRDALQGHECGVHAFGGLEEAAEDIKCGYNPSVVFADRWIDGEPIEKRLLFEIKKARPNSLVVIYTRKDELTYAQEAEILSMGAIRVLDRHEIADSADKLLQEFRELRELSFALDELTRGRSDLTTALVGTDVGVTVIDRQYICWFANNRQRELVCGRCTGGLCWRLFHDQPDASGPCWGCGIQDVLATGIPVQRTILSHLHDNSVRWLSVQTKPINGSAGHVIAGSEAVSVLEYNFINNMDSNERLFGVARGLVHAGFSRVRIYQRQPNTESNKIVAAASREYNFEDKAYFNLLRQLVLKHTDDPYWMRAIESETGILVNDWDKGISPFAKTVGITLPYLLVPVWDEDNESPEGLIVADFTDSKWNAARRDIAIRHLAKQETVEWIRKDYCIEASKAFVGIQTDRSAVCREAFARQQAALRARQRIGAASSLKDAIAALCEGFSSIGPDCKFFVRHKRGNSLVAESQLCVPRDIKINDVIFDDDRNSLSVFVLKTYLRPLWIDDFHAYRQGNGPFAGPKGLSGEDIRSIARLPVRFETTDFGILCIDSPYLHKWQKEGFIDPLLSLAEQTALVLRDLVIWEEHEEARKQIEQAEHLQVKAQVSELQTVASIADLLPVAVFVKSKDHRFRYVNEQFCKDAGKSKEIIIGSLDVDLYGGEFGTQYQHADDDIMKTGKSYVNDREPHPDSMGNNREMHVIKTPFRSPNGDIEGIVGVFWDVTEANKGFRQLQSWRDGFVQSANAIVYAHDMKGKISFINGAAAKKLGYGIDELEGRSIYDLVVPEDRKAVKKAIHSKPSRRDKLLNESVREFRVFTKDVREISLEVATSECDIRPDERGILGVAHDVTERNRVRLQLDQELQKTRALRSIASGLGRADEVCTLHRLFLLAVTHGQCLGFSRAILFLPTDEPNCFAACLAVGATTLAAARERWAEANKAPFDEAVINCLRSVVPIRPDDLQSVVGNLNIDLRQETEIANGIRLGKPFIQRLGQPSPIKNPRFAEATRSDIDKDVEFVLAPLRKGEKTVGILWADRAFLDNPVVEESSVQHFEILWTETALMAQALNNRAREEEARVAQDLARGMSYSLYTRSGILEFDLWLLKDKLGDKYADAIEEMSKSIEFFKHAGALATKDLRFAEIGIVEHEDLDFNAVVKDVVDRRQDGKIAINLSKEALPVWMNRTHAEDIVVEILGNALDFANKASPRVEVTTANDGGFARLDIADNGPGIFPALRPDLFKRFKRYPEGRMGMGLAYIKGLVDAYGGSIAELRETGSGAHFVVRIPFIIEETQNNATGDTEQ